MYIDNGLFDEVSALIYHKFFEQLSYEVDYFIYLDFEPELALKRIKTVTGKTILHWRTWSRCMNSMKSS